ncbi:uncharacterized protein LOC126655347 [Mercurialis annua]|uniref:uncharacterized protein LOC126655347 n=1 Tax=Mercurialis annua TaxID=3986 RepID=UPI00215F708A|nr:uncharacterized protein LOC126655347 [Mercurialis annua]
MASTPEEPPCNSATEEETIALRKKRSRRVSFADREITSVHIFNRDEDYETPPDSSGQNLLLQQQNKNLSDEENELLGFFRDLADVDDCKEDSPINANDEDDEDVDDVNLRSSFFRTVESPSSGGSGTIAGSATSNDEDNFFGPVSVSFLRHGRFSDSAASDDNHDVTMDSTAFSMHFRSLARSESGGNTSIEKKTPSHIATPSDSELMDLTKAKKLLPRFCLSVEKASGGRDSNDMSLISENPRNYDYGKLSPNLETLLAEGSKDLNDASVSHSTNQNLLKRAEAFLSNEILNGQVDEEDYEEKEAGKIGNTGKTTVDVSEGQMELDEANGSLSSNHVDQNTGDYTSRQNEYFTADVSVEQEMETFNQLSNMNNNCTKYMDGMNFPTISDVAPQSIDGKIAQFNSFAQHESIQNPNGGCLEESSPKDRRGNHGIFQSSDQLRSPLGGSSFPVSVAQKQIFLHAAKSGGQLSYVTPSPKQPGSFFSQENVKISENVLSIHKSSSRIKLFEPSPLAHTLKDGIERSKLRLSKFHSSNDVAEEKCNDIRNKNMVTPVVNLEKHLFNVDRENIHHKDSGYKSIADISNPKNYGNLTINQGAVTLLEDGESLISKEGANLMSTEVASPLYSAPSHKKAEQHGLIPEKSRQKNVVVSGSDSPSSPVKLDHRNDANTYPPDNLISPSAKKLKHKLSSSKKQPGSLSYVLQYDNLAGIVLGQDKIANASGDSHFNTVTDELEMLSAEGRIQSNPPLLEVSHFRENKVHEPQHCSPDMQQTSETLPSFVTPLRVRNSLKCHSGSPGKNVPLTTGQILSGQDINVQKNETFSGVPSSPSILRGFVNEPSHMKIPFEKEILQSPCRKDLGKVLNDENVHSLTMKITLSPKPTSNGPVHGDSHMKFHISDSDIFVQNLPNSSIRKRKIKELVPVEASHADKFKRTAMSPNIHTTQISNSELMLECASGSDNNEKMTGSDTAMKHWSDILLKFSAETQQLLSPSIDKLKITSIDLLQDILVHLQRTKMYDTFCSQLCPQKICDQLNEFRKNRIAETMKLLYKLAYGKARQQLMSVTREKMLKRAEQLTLAVQKSHMLNSNRKCLCLPNDNTAIDGNLKNPVGVNLSKKDEVSRNKVVTMKHEFEALDRQIVHLTKEIHGYCKMKGEPSISKTLALLNDQLKTKGSCRLIHEKLQLWKVDEFARKNGKQTIVLDYQGLLSQRFAINGGPISNIFVSAELDDLNIAKIFPNMDACVAFSCVLNTKTIKKNIGYKSFAQETQVTCSLLHNLLDVVGEVQHARVEIRNLIHTSFQSSSVEQLDLQLSFLDFNNGRKVMVTLDMACLNRGVYPSDILPYQLQAFVAGAYMSLPETLSAKIKDAADGLKVGYSRIMRLCKCISQVLESSST